jgi:predicted transcriptional regulator of viral defense system
MKKASLEDARALRLLDALVASISEATFVITVPELAKRAQVTPSVARMAIDQWAAQRWVYPFPDSPSSRRFIVTSSAPTTPNDAAIDALALMQIMNATDYRMGRLCYGYGSALSYHGLSDLVQSPIFVFVSDQTVQPPKLPEDLPFARSTKTPTRWGEWHGRPAYRIRRSPDNLRPYQREQLQYQGIRVPCTTALKTLIDCWVRPDLAGGEDRVDDAWQRYLSEHRSELATIARDVALILNDSYWPSMRRAFLPWIERTHPDLAEKGRS